MKFWSKAYDLDDMVQYIDQEYTVLLNNDRHL